MPVCRTGHIRTYYQDIGKKDAPILLLLHGWGHSWETWATYIPLLSEKYRLIIPDLPGFGQTDSSFSGWNMWQYSQWLEDFLNTCGFEALHGVIGHSFGGKLFSFAWFAYGDTLKLPPVKQGFFALSPSGIVRPLPLTRKILSTILSLFPLYIKRRLFGGIRRFLYTTILGETDYLVASPFQEASLRKFLREDIAETVTTPKDFPLHFAWGKNDQAVGLWMAYKYRTISTSATLFVVPDGDHFFHLTHPNLTLQWLETHL